MNYLFSKESLYHLITIQRLWPMLKFFECKQTQTDMAKTICLQSNDAGA